MIEQLRSSKRIIIQGSSGAGKSTLATQLGEILNLPVVHLDKEFWLPNWQRPNSDNWLKKQLDIIQEEKWIVEGGAYQRALPHRAKASDFVIFLDFNRFLCLYRCYNRAKNNKGKSRSDMAPGCEDKVDLEFAKWILFEQPQQANPLALKTIKENIQHSNLMILKSPLDVKLFLRQLF